MEKFSLGEDFASGMRAFLVRPQTDIPSKAGSLNALCCSTSREL